MLRFRRDRVATTPSASTGTGHRRRGPARPPRNALRRFTFVRHHDTSMASSRPVLTEAPAAHNQAALGTARSIPGRALASSMLDSPYQGSRTGLTPPISTPVPSTPAQALALRARAFATTPPSWHPTEGSGTINQTRPTTRGGSTSSVRRGATADGRSDRRGSLRGRRPGLPRTAPSAAPAVPGERGGQVRGADRTGRR